MACYTPSPSTQPPLPRHIVFSSSFSYKIRFSESWLDHCPLLICHIMGSLKAQENEMHPRDKADGLSRLASGAADAAWHQLASGVLTLSSSCPKHLGLK